MVELKPGYRIGPYVISEFIPGGKGGMAYVYVAQRHLEGEVVQEVILKVMKAGVTDQQAQQFFSEAINNEVETLRRLHHPHIVHLYPISWGTKRNPYIARITTLPGQPWFYVMEYLRGGSIKKLIQSRGTVPVKTAVEITYQLSLALDFMHSKGISHLDIKPENVLLRYPLKREYPLEAVLIDFGIARRQKVETIAGSLPFMPPERVKVLKGMSPPEKVGENEPVDIYGLGVTLFQMLTGKLPFSGRTKSSITTAILSQTPTAPSTYNHDVPPQLDDVVWKMLSKDPGSRPSASEIPSMLDEAVAPPRFVFGSSQMPRTPREEETHESVSTGKIAVTGGKGWKIASAALLLVAALEAMFFLSPLRGKVLVKSGKVHAGTPTVAGAVNYETPTRVFPTPTATATVLPTATEVTENEGHMVATPVPTDTPVEIEPTSTPLPTFTPVPVPTSTNTP